METEILDFLNEKIREEHGNRVNIDSLWSDADVDSFGSVVIFFELDDKYNCFPDTWVVANLTGETPIKLIVEKALNESKEL